VTPEWQAVCRIDEVPAQDVRRFELRGLPPLAVYNVDGNFYVTDDCCTHEKVSLADGTLDGDVIECPLHGGRFNFITGEVVSRPPIKKLRTYETRVEDEMVSVLVPADAGDA
jgi:nitrite reductase/ring-hydroxylating ferredoxin subunit